MLALLRGVQKAPRPALPVLRGKAAEARKVILLGPVESLGADSEAIASKIVELGECMRHSGDGNGGMSAASMARHMGEGEYIISRAMEYANRHAEARRSIAGEGAAAHDQGKD